MKWLDLNWGKISTLPYNDISVYYTSTENKLNTDVAYEEYIKYSTKEIIFTPSESNI